MKHFIKYIHVLVLFGALLCYSVDAKSQAIKTNIPFTITGNPNFGVEWSVGKQLTVNTDLLWMPYLFKKNEEVFRALVGSIDIRHYLNPRYYYTNDLWDGLYVGPYVMAGNFNIGLKNKDPEKTSYRRKGWGISSGVTAGYKLYLSTRFRLDFNIGVGYAHLQYDKYELGGEFVDYPIDKKKTKSYIGPTKLGISLVYNFFK